MIPLKLAIQNFLSYGPTTQVIDFTPYKLICLSGKNGHGKSAMLDAITWALWGQARKATATSKPDQGLLRLGQTDMVVSLDFIFNAQTYRVRRMFSTKYGKPSTHVDFGTYNKETSAYNPLTEKTIRKTQEKIEHTIGLDYDSFINSSFLRQGQANEFSKKLPKERKDVLATILGLHKYERTKKQALEQMRLLTQERETVIKINEHVFKEIQELPKTEQNLYILNKELQTVLEEEKRLGDEKQALDQLKAQLYKKHSDWQLVTHEYKQVQEEKQKTITSYLTLKTVWKKTHAMHLQLPDTNNIESQKKALLQKLAEYQTLYQTTLEEKEKLLIYRQKELELTAVLRASHEQQLQQKTLTLERLAAERKNLLQSITQTQNSLDQTTKEQDLCQKNTEELSKTADATLLINDSATLEKQFERQKNWYIRWVDEGKRASQELQNLGHKEQLTHDANNPSCPLCEQNLSQARKRFLSKKFETQQIFLTHRIARLKSILGTLKTVLEKQKQAIEISKKTDTLLQKHTELSESIRNLQTTLQLILQQRDAIDNEIAKISSEIHLLQTTAASDVAQHHEYQSLQKLKQACEQQIAHNEHIPHLIKTLTEQHAHLHNQVQQQQSIDKEKGEQKERKNKMKELFIHLQQLEKQNNLLLQQLHIFASLEKEQAECTRQEQAWMQRQEHQTTHKNALLQEKGKLEAEITKLEQQIAQHKQFEQQIKDLTHAIEEYHLIAQAFGKDGIQALLIEDALPEIENEANDLLSRLTDNQAHIFIESLRDLKKGGVKETLDINISDSSGIRPYEMFSGGEAFRIDFSLRIAISKLLARRAGTSLQTLIIDEGFGSQDEEGLSRIMDCLYKIQDDFEKIIIVSHLAAMKDQFPVHFYIEKGPHGSCTFVKEQG